MRPLSEATHLVSFKSHPSFRSIIDLMLNGCKNVWWQIVINVKTVFAHNLCAPYILRITYYVSMKITICQTHTLHSLLLILSPPPALPLWLPLVLFLPSAGSFGCVAKLWAGLWDWNVALNNWPGIHGTLISYRDIELWTTEDLTQTPRSKSRSNQTSVQDPFEDAASPTLNW